MERAMKYYLVWRLCLISAVYGGATACADLMSAPSFPSGVSDPQVYNTEAGALGMYRTVVTLFESSPTLEYIGSSDQHFGAFGHAVLLVGPAGGERCWGWDCPDMFAWQW